MTETTPRSAQGVAKVSWSPTTASRKGQTHLAFQTGFLGNSRSRACGAALQLGAQVSGSLRPWEAAAPTPR